MGEPAFALENEDSHGGRCRLCRLCRSCRLCRLSMMRAFVRCGVLAVLAAVVLAVAWPPALTAQVTADLADALVRETYEAIREDALRPPDVLTLLHETVLTTQRTLISAGVTDPPPLPAFTGQEDWDLTAAAAYVQAATVAAPRCRGHHGGPGRAPRGRRHRPPVARPRAGTGEPDALEDDRATHRVPAPAGIL